MEYRGRFIEEELGGFTVFYCGDELFFETEKEAMDFIDEIAKG